MGIINLFFGLFRSFEHEQKEMPWNKLTSIEQINDIIEESKEKHVVIFKHSKRCGISRMVLRDFQRNYMLAEDQVKIYYLDILSYRELSDEISIIFQVFHESPQLLIIKNGITIHHRSHYRIDAKAINDYISIDS